MPWLGRDRVTGALTQWEVRRSEKRQNSQAIIRGQAVVEEGTVLAFHLCKPGGRRNRLRNGQRHHECLLNAPCLQQPLQEPSLAGSPSCPIPLCPSSQALESFIFFETKKLLLWGDGLWNKGLLPRSCSVSSLLSKVKG